MKLKVLGCMPLKRELYLLAATSPHDITFDLLNRNTPQSIIQEKLYAEAQSDYIVLALGEEACANLCSGNTPIAAARVHNCAHLLLGSRKRYLRAFSENEDSPNWLNCAHHEIPATVSNPCIVRSGITPAPDFELPVDTREYVADLSLIKALLHGTWENEQIMLVPQNSRIVSDPVEILNFEPK